MKQEFWHSRWAENRIGFHQLDTHPWLEKYWRALSPSREQRVLVPLCGKSVDLVWLAAHHEHVAGVELSDIAVKSFFSEHLYTPLVTRLRSGYSLYQFDEIVIHQTDFFMFNEAIPFELAYDRAGLVALNESQRQPYVDHLLSQLTDDGKLLLITVTPTLDNDAPTKNGPPFVIADDELSNLFEGTTLTLLGAEKSDARFDEKVWLIEK